MAPLEGVKPAMQLPLTMLEPETDFPRLNSDGELMMMIHSTAADAADSTAAVASDVMAAWLSSLGYRNFW